MTDAQSLTRTQAGSKVELQSAVLQAAENAACLIVGSGQRIPPEAATQRVMECDISGLCHVIEHSVADQVIHVESGISIGELNKLLAKHNQFFPVRLPSAWSLLDALGCGESGSLEHGYGGMRDLVLGGQLLLSDGSITTCGGRVVKNVTGYDVTKLIVGSHNWLAIPLSAYLRVYALPNASLTFVWSFDSLWKLMGLAKALITAALPLSALEALPNDNLGVGKGKFLLLVQVLSLESVAKEVSQRLLEIAGPAETTFVGLESDRVWNQLAEIFLSCACDQSLCVVAPPTLVPDVISSLPQGSSWTARPARGKVFIVCKNVADAVLALKKVSNNTRQKLTVAFADSRYNYRVGYLPEADVVKEGLVTRLKSQLDPAGLLNPFVSF